MALVGLQTLDKIPRGERAGHVPNLELYLLFPNRKRVGGSLRPRISLPLLEVFYANQCSEELHSSSTIAALRMVSDSRREGRLSAEPEESLLLLMMLSTY